MIKKKHKEEKMGLCEQEQTHKTWIRIFMLTISSLNSVTQLQQDSPAANVAVQENDQWSQSEGE